MSRHLRYLHAWLTFCPQAGLEEENPKPVFHQEPRCHVSISSHAGVLTSVAPPAAALCALSISLDLNGCSTKRPPAPDGIQAGVKTPWVPSLPPSPDRFTFVSCAHMLKTSPLSLSLSLPSSSAETCGSAGGTMEATLFIFGPWSLQHSVSIHPQRIYFFILNKRL